MSEFLNDQQNSSLSSQLQNTHKSTKQSTYFNHEFSSSSLLYSQPILLYIKNLRPELVALSKLIYENNHPTEIANVLKTLERIAVGVLKDDGRDTKILTEKRRITGNLLCESNVVYALTSLFSSLAVLSIVAKDDDMRSCNSPFFQQAVILRSYFTTLAKSSSSAEFDFFSRNFRGLDDMLAVITNFVGRSSSVLADTNNIPSIGDLCNMVFLQSNSSGDTVSLIDRGRRMNDWMILLHLLFTTLAVLADVSEECFVVVHTNIFQSDYVLPVLLLSPAHQPTAITLIRKFLSRALSFLNQQRSQTAQQSVVHVDHIGGIITPLLIALHLIPYETETGLLLPILNALHSSLKLSYLVQNVFVEIRGIQTLFFIMREVMKMKPSKAPSSHTPSNSLTDNEIFLPTLSIYLMCLRCFTVSVSNNKRNKARVRDGGEIIPQMIRILVASGLFNELFVLFIFFLFIVFFLLRLFFFFFYRLSFAPFVFFFLHSRCAYLICETLFDMMHDIDKERLSISTFSPSDGGAESYSYPDSERLDNALFTPSDVGPVMFGSAAKILIHVCVCVPDDVADAVWERMVELAEFSNEVCVRRRKL
jgi:hypothetical protein